MCVYNDDGRRRIGCVPLYGRDDDTNARPSDETDKRNYYNYCKNKIFIQTDFIDIITLITLSSIYRCRPVAAVAVAVPVYRYSRVSDYNNRCNNDIIMLLDL